ncbi:hypothetical protein AAFM46_15055 [Arthrobacter sp. TMP15]|uniref:hypothetical protein n=1 Tax=Arthrobacter sp. TMP15 TaxID=3140789 RepID=UPI0031BBA988
MPKSRLVHKFMRFTGHLRYVLGPANSSPLDHEMTPQNKVLLASQQAAAAQFVVLKRVDGSSYLVARDPQDQSLR